MTDNATQSRYTALLQAIEEYVDDLEFSERGKGEVKRSILARAAELSAQMPVADGNPVPSREAVEAHCATLVIPQTIDMLRDLLAEVERLTKDQDAIIEEWSARCRLAMSMRDEARATVAAQAAALEKAHSIIGEFLEHGLDERTERLGRAALASQRSVPREPT